MSENQANADNQEANLIPVNITIADRSYRIKLAAKDEEAVRKTAALINQKWWSLKMPMRARICRIIYLWFYYGSPPSSSRRARTSMS